MLIDQRNNGAAVTIGAGSTYALDRWKGFGIAADGVFTLQQDSSAPAGFNKSLKATVTTADASIDATQTYLVFQSVEGNNIIDFDFGNAGAKTVTLSFWVRSSLTGTFGGALRNGASNRSYVFTYSISAADTWEKKSVTVTGDTTGTWLKDTGTGMNVTFSLGAGIDRSETAGAWYASNRPGATGQVQVIGTLNATWYVAGVQLELGSVSTEFSNAGGTIQGELAACQRYYYRAGVGETEVYAALTNSGFVQSSTVVIGMAALPVTMRTRPSTTVDVSNVGFRQSNGVTIGTSALTIDASQSSANIVSFSATVTSATAATPGFFVKNNNGAGFIGFSAEL
jgi:hypothetical protein